MSTFPADIDTCLLTELFTSIDNHQPTGAPRHFLTRPPSTFLFLYFSLLFSLSKAIWLFCSCYKTILKVFIHVEIPNNEKNAMKNNLEHLVCQGRLCESIELFIRKLNNQQCSADLNYPDKLKNI